MKYKVAGAALFSWSQRCFFGLAPAPTPLYSTVNILFLRDYKYDYKYNYDYDYKYDYDYDYDYDNEYKYDYDYKYDHDYKHRWAPLF